MKINHIIIKDHQQFGKVNLRLVYPKGHKKEGMPLEKICLIGKNGTGKTTLLNLLFVFLARNNFLFGVQNFVIGLTIENTSFYVLKNRPNRPILLKRDIEMEVDWVKDFWNLEESSFMQRYEHYQCTSEVTEENLRLFQDKTQKLLIHAPSEVHQNELLKTADVPKTNLDKALKLFKTFPYVHNASFQNVSDFWNLLIYQIKKRDSDYQDFLEKEENQNKVLSVLKAEFNRKNPFFLNRLSEIWNRILGKAGLYFDFEQAKVPTQLTDNLEAFIKLKSTQNKIHYSQLSSGIRNYIFRLGYIASLFFNRKVKSAIVLIDEPENSLFPDLLYDLISQYESVTRRTQFFVATHSPIIAAEFEPEERVLLNFDEFGMVITDTGKAPLGDEPNDVLMKDFGIENLLGKEGIKKWERYVELKILIKQEDDQSKKEALTEEFLEIGKEYNF